MDNDDVDPTDPSDVIDDNGTEVDISTLTPLQIVGSEDGTILPDGEKVVYEYADDGTTFTGWHKEAADG